MAQVSSKADSRGLARATCVQVGDLQRWGSPTCPTGIGPSFFLRSGWPTLFGFGDRAQPSEQGRMSFPVRKSDAPGFFSQGTKERVYLVISK